MELRIKYLLDEYDKRGMIGVVQYLYQYKELINSEHYKNTWLNKIYKLLQNKNYQSVECEIASLLNTFKLKL